MLTLVMSPVDASGSFCTHTVNTPSLSLRGGGGGALVAQVSRSIANEMVSTPSLSLWGGRHWWLKVSNYRTYEPVSTPSLSLRGCVVALDRSTRPFELPKCRRRSDRYTYYPETRLALTEFMSAYFGRITRDSVELCQDSVPMLGWAAKDGELTWP